MVHFPAGAPRDELAVILKGIADEDPYKKSTLEALKLNPCRTKAQKRRPKTCEKKTHFVTKYRRHN